MSRPAVELRKVYKVYLLGKIKVVALRNINLKIMPGEFVAIMGASGSGKTTLLNIIGGIDRPTYGDVLVDGVNTIYLSEDELASLRAKKIGFVFQFFNLIPVLNALENVMLPMSLNGGLSKAEMRARAKMLLELVGLGDRLYHKPTELSGGQSQRVAIARALANNPAIVLADEPTGNLDSKSGRDIMNLMKKLNKERGQTFIVVTHDPEVASYADRIIRVRDGRIIEDKRKN